MRYLPILFVLLALPVCLSNVFILPPGEVPDEIAHIIRADGLRRGAIIGEHGTIGGQVTSGVRADLQLVAGWNGPDGPLPERKATLEHMTELGLVPWGNVTFIGVPNTAAYMPLLYIPTALTLTVAQLLGKPPFVAVQFARLINGLIYIGVGTAAIGLSRRGSWLIFTVLILPMSLSMGSSCNQDGGLIAVSALSAALLTRPKSQRAFWCATVLLAVVTAAKPVYAPLAIILMFAAQSTRTAFLGAALVAVPAITWLVASQSRASSPLRALGSPQPPGPLWSGDPSLLLSFTDPADQIWVLLDAPWRFITLPARTLWQDLSFKLPETIGVLGRLDLVLPHWFYLLSYVAIVCSLVLGCLSESGDISGRRASEAAGPPFWQSMLYLLCIISSLWLIYIAQYITWTPLGATRVDGVQGRYFIPLLLYVPVMLPQCAVPGLVPLRWLLRAPAAAAAAIGAALIPIVNVTSFYLR